MPVRRAGGQGAQHRQTGAQAAVRQHRRLGIGQAHVHLHCSGRRAEEPCVLGDDRVVARRRREDGRAQGRRRMQPDRHGADTAIGDPRSQAAQVAHDVLGAHAHRGIELHLVGVDLALHHPVETRRPAHRVDQWRGSCSEQLAGRVHQHQLFLDPDGELTARVELRDGGTLRGPWGDLALPEGPGRAREAPHASPPAIGTRSGRPRRLKGYPVHCESCPPRSRGTARLPAPISGTGPP